MTAPRVISLASLEAPLPRLELADGSTLAIRAIDGIGMQMLQLVQAGDAAQAWPVAARCLPDAPEGFVLTLTLPQVQTIIKIATGGADTVLAELGNVTPPPTQTASAAALSIL